MTRAAEEEARTEGGDKTENNDTQQENRSTVSIMAATVTGNDLLNYK